MLDGKIMKVAEEIRRSLVDMEAEHTRHVFLADRATSQEEAKKHHDMALKFARVIGLLNTFYAKVTDGK